MEDVEGTYIRNPAQNDWHHVTVTAVQDEDGKISFLWTNRAGVSWTISHSPDCNGSLLKVEDDCPYHSDGYKECKVLRKPKRRDGKIVALLGPGKERYVRVDERREITLPTWTGDHEGRRHAIVLPTKGSGEDWADLAFLAAVPAGAMLNGGGRSAVLVPQDCGNGDDDAFADFVLRHRPTEMDIFDSDQVRIDAKSVEEEETVIIRRHAWEGLGSATAILARIAWLDAGSSSSRIVVAQEHDYSAALLASSIASRLYAPLFYAKGGAFDLVALQAARDFCPSEILFVGEEVDENTSSLLDEFVVGESSSSPEIVSISTAISAVEWLSANGLPLNYIALVNPLDRKAPKSCQSRKLSLTGPVYAARRSGLVVPLLDISLGEGDSGDNEDALRSSLDQLRSIITTCPCPPEHIALVGGFDVLPVCRTDSDCNSSGLFAVTDIPYGQLEGYDCCDSPRRFRDLAIGRIYAESLCCGSLLAARSVNYELLVDRSWEQWVVESGLWGFPEVTHLFKVAGAVEEDHLRHLVRSDLESSQTVDAAVFLHKDHSCGSHLGNSAAHNSHNLYSPAVVTSRGCSGAAIDRGAKGLPPGGGSVAGRMLGRGCVCFVGSPRTSTAPGTLTEVAFFHELLYGDDDNCKNGGNNEESTMTVGRAMRAAYNKAVVHHLDGGHMPPYGLENQILMGDPALVPCFSGSGRRNLTKEVAPAKSTLDDSVVTVAGPSEWMRAPIHKNQLKEWKYKGDLFTYVGPLVEQETIWCRKGFDKQDLYHVVAITLPPGTNVTDAIPLDAVEINEEGTETPLDDGKLKKRWWRSGKHYLHRHWDGSVTVHWRILMLKYDMLNGTKKSELKSARVRLVLES